MNDMTRVIVPKSDQQNADDFVSGPRTFVIEGVDIQPVPDQPVSIFLRGEKRPYKPCKSMSRVLVAAWGPDASTYAGRSLTLYRDPSIKWGGMEVGGIRISHMSHIDREMIMALTKTKGQRAPYTVKVLATPQGQQTERAPLATFTLKEIFGPPFQKTLAGITDAIGELETAGPEIVAANAEWLSSLPVDRLPSLRDRIETLIAGCRLPDAPAPV